MKELNIESSSNSPRVVFDPDSFRFEISGESRPENVSAFYKPILDWVKELESDLMKKDGSGSSPIEFNFKLDYFNSTSAKFILDICKKLGTIHDQGYKIKVRWHYEEDDEDMQLVGQEMSRMSKMPFDYVAIKI
jgi:hypothetical protein